MKKPTKQKDTKPTQQSNPDHKKDFLAVLKQAAQPKQSSK